MAKPGKAPKKAKKLTKGHAVTKLAKAARPSYRKGRLSKRTALVRSVIREVTGFAPYERKIIEFLQAGSTKDEKKSFETCQKKTWNS
jgi:Ribosomal protein L36E